MDFLGDNLFQIKVLINNETMVLDLLVSQNIRKSYWNLSSSIDMTDINKFLGEITCTEDDFCTFNLIEPYIGKATTIVNRTSKMDDLELKRFFIKSWAKFLGFNELCATKLSNESAVNTSQVLICNFNGDGALTAKFMEKK